MTISSLEVYIITRLDIFNAWVITAVSAYVALVVVYLIANLTRSLNIDDKSIPRECDTLMGCIRKAKPHIFLPILLAITIFVPSSKEMAAIKIIPAIANSEIVQDKIPEALNGLVDLATDWMKELSPEHKETML